jgi:hypothetical protein
MTPMEAAMTATREASEHPMPDRVGRWWMRWRTHWAALADLVQFSPAELEWIARDVGVGAHELHVLAGKWPDAADSLTRRAGAVGLDAGEIGRTDPLVMRDLQRVCSLCDSKARCEHDLSRAPNDPRWQDYCPNAVSLGVPESKRSKTPDGKGN